MIEETLGFVVSLGRTIRNFSEFQRVLKHQLLTQLSQLIACVIQLRLITYQRKCVTEFVEISTKTNFLEAGRNDR